MSHRQALELALEAFKSGDLRDIEVATEAIKQALSKPAQDMTPAVLYEWLNKIGASFEVVEIFDGVRTIRFDIKEEDDEAE